MTVPLHLINNKAEKSRDFSALLFMQLTYPRYIQLVFFDTYFIDLVF